MPLQDIKIAGAPLVWSEVDYAFKVINQNLHFLEDQLTLDTSALNVDLIPNGAYSLGTIANSWTNLYVDNVYTAIIEATDITSAVIDTDELIIGSGTLKVVNGYLSYVDTITGDPLETQLTPAFSTISVSGQPLVTADFGDTLTIVEGAGIALVTDENTKTVTISSDATVVVIDTVDITADIDPISKEVSLSLVNPNKFDRVAVNGLDSTVDLLIAADPADTLNLAEGYGVILTGNPIVNEVTISIDPEVDLYSNIYADDSTLLVDARNGSISWDVLTGVPDIVIRTASTGSILLPVGTTAQRDLSPVTGYVRYNTTTGKFEGRNATQWISFEMSTDQHKEFTSTYATAGSYTLNIFDGDTTQATSYKIICKSAEGVQISTLDVVFDTTSFEVEYGVILTTDIRIANFTTSVDASNNVWLTIQTLYNNVDVVFRKTPLSNI